MRTALPEQLPRSCRAVGSPVELQGSRPTQVAQMRAPLCWLLLVAHAVDMLAQTLRKKQVDTGLGGNCTGCIACSEVNGCSSCQHRLFLFISREGMRQYGKCLHDCPPGFFGVRGQDLNQCRSTWLPLVPCWPGLPGSAGPQPTLSPSAARKEAGVCLSQDSHIHLVPGWPRSPGPGTCTLATVYCAAGTMLLTFSGLGPDGKGVPTPPLFSLSPGTNHAVSEPWWKRSRKSSLPAQICYVTSGRSLALSEPQLLSKREFSAYAAQFGVDGGLNPMLQSRGLLRAQPHPPATSVPPPWQVPQLGCYWLCYRMSKHVREML
uniref:R-spondin Fu-CRD domain-containing protein n=1 Tax=Oryctolagus cuniculus TaxID=9986 RepID=G1U2S0_RABIT